MKSVHHQVPIVRITEITSHTNADTLELIKIGEYQVVTKKGQFKPGELAVYIYPDSVVPQTEPFKFIWGPYMESLQNTPGYEFLNAPVTVPEKKRRITVRKFRGEWSEGLLLPVTDFGMDGYVKNSETNETMWVYKEGANHWVEGQDVSDELGITHYDPDAGKEDGAEEFAPKKKKKYPKTFRGWVALILSKIRFWRGKEFLEETDSLGIPIYDVDSYKAKPANFVLGEPVRVSEKLHGSNARYMFLDGIMYVGSRNKWTAPGSANPFRNALRLNPWIQSWCEAHPGYVLWGEVTGVQKGYDYGSKDHQFFVFDVYTPDGNWIDESTPEGLEILTHLQEHWVPVLYKGPYQGYDHVKTFVDGNSTVRGAKHIREGVVVATTNRNGKRSQRKIVSNVFLDKDNK